MKTLKTPDALDSLARRVKQFDDSVEVFVLPFDPEGPSSDNDLHVAVLADVDDSRMDEFMGMLAETIESTNVELDFDPFVVAHPSNTDSIALLSRIECSISLSRSTGTRATETAAINPFE